MRLLIIIRILNRVFDVGVNERGKSVDNQYNVNVIEGSFNQ